MKKTITSLLLAIAAINVTLAADSISLSSEKLTEFQKNINVFRNKTVSILDGVDMGNYYFFKLEVKNRRGSKTTFLISPHYDAFGNNFSPFGSKLLIG